MLYNAIVEDLTTKIITDELPVGTKLKSERLIAEEYKVSRNVVREAIKVLSEKGLLVAQQGKGTYVCKPNLDMLSQNIELLILRDNINHEEMLEVRKTLIVDSIRKAAVRASDEDIDKLTALNDSFSPSSTYAEFARWDSMVHHYLYKLCGNTLLENLNICFYSIMDQDWFILRQHFPEHIQKSQKEHQAIINALKTHTPDLCEKAMLDHFEPLYCEVYQLKQT